MSFSKFLSNLGHFLVMSILFVVLVLLIPAGIVFVIIISVKTEIYIAPPVLIPTMLAVYSLPLNWFLGHLCGARFENTGYVSEGTSVIAMVRDEAYYKRAIYVNFIILTLFVLSVFYFVFILTLDFTWGLVGLTMSIVGAIFYFLLGMSAIEKSGIKNRGKKDKEEFAEEFKNAEPIKKEPKKIKTKFNFEQYPELFNLYSSYKNAKNRAIHLKHDPNYIEEYKQECLKRDDSFEKLSRVIYDIFNEDKPVILNKKTNEQVSWSELFNNSFDKLTKKQKDYLVRLLDGYPYQFENKKYYNN